MPTPMPASADPATRGWHLKGWPPLLGDTWQPPQTSSARKRMAPHRLTRSDRLKEAELTGWRWWIIRHTPTVLIDYLFEILLAAAAAITSIAYFGGISAESSVIRVLPTWLAIIYGVAMSVGAATVALGLVVRRYGTTLAFGLRVLAVGCLVYSVSAAGYVGLRALAPIVMSTILGVLAAWRAFILYSTYLKIAADFRGERGRPGCEP